MDTQSDGEVADIEVIGSASSIEHANAAPAKNSKGEGAAATTPMNHTDVDMKGPFLVRLQHPIPRNSRFSTLYSQNKVEIHLFREKTSLTLVRTTNAFWSHPKRARCLAPQRRVSIDPLLTGTNMWGHNSPSPTSHYLLILGKASLH